MIKIRNKRVLLELIQDGLDVERVLIAQKLDKDELTNTILSAAKTRGIPVEETPYHKMPFGRDGEKRDVIVGYLNPAKNVKLSDLLDNLGRRGEEPFLLLLDKVGFANNVGVIARTAYAAGVNGIIYQGEKDKIFNEDSFQASSGLIAKLPFVKMNAFDAIDELHEHGILIYALDMNGKTYFNEDLTGPAVFVLGAERDGVSSGILKRCDKQLSIPMKPGIESLNVAASASIIMYEKFRQQMTTS